MRNMKKRWQTKNLIIGKLANSIVEMLFERELESELKRQPDDKARQEAKDAERLLQARKAAAKEKKKTACPKCGHLDDEMNFLAGGWGGVLPALAVPVSLFVFFWLDDFFPDTVGLITTKWGSIGLWVVKGSVFVAICSGLFWPLSVVRAKCSACGARFKGGDIIKPT